MEGVHMKNTTYLSKLMAKVIVLGALTSNLAFAANQTPDIVIHITGGIVETTVNVPNNTGSANINTALSNQNVSISTVMISATAGIKTITYA
jgi:hypothetical protein